MTFNTFNEETQVDFGALYGDFQTLIRYTTPLIALQKS